MNVLRYNTSECHLPFLQHLLLGEALFQLGGVGMDSVTDPSPNASSAQKHLSMLLG